MCIYIYIHITKSVRELSETPGRHRADASPEINEQENKRAKTENTGKDQSKNGKRPTDGTPINRKTENGNSRRKKNRGREQRTGGGEKTVALAKRDILLALAKQLPKRTNVPPP